MAAQTPYLAGESPEAIEANRQYQEAMRKLTDSLSNRKKPFIDPVWAAAAKGFLAPKQTGSFFESLGPVAENVSKAQAEQLKIEQDILQQKVGLAGQGIELQRMRERDADVSKWLNPESKPAAPTGGLPTAAPPKPGALSGAEPSLPAAPTKGALASLGEPEEEDDGGVQIFPPIPSLMTQRDYVRANRLSNKPLGELMKEGSEIERKSLEVKESGTTNLRKGKFYPSKLNLMDYPIQGEGYEGKSFKIPEGVALELSSLLRRGEEAAYKKLADKYTKGFAATGKPVSVEERALQGKRTEKLQEAEVAQEIEDRKNFVQRARDAGDTITTATVFRRFSEDPNASKMVGILNNDKISSGIAALVKEGFGIPGFTAGTKAIEDVMRNAGLNAAEQAKYRTFLMYATQMQLLQSKYMKGSVSNFEQQLMANAGVNAQDTPESIRMKADLMTRRAQFDRKAAKALKASKMTADEFLDSDEYNEMRDKYDVELADLSSGSTILVPAKKAEQGAAPSTGFVKDPKTGVIRKKREGE
jgi:hypothetical protein